MSLADLYADELKQSVADRAAHPVLGPAPDVAHSWTDLAKAPFQGVGAGGLEAGGSVLDMAGAFGQVTAATGTMNAGGMFAGATTTEQQQAEGAHRKLVEQGVDMSDPMADRLRTRARDVMPDAQTSSTAANVVSGFFRFGGKAAGYMGTAGPLGALPLAIDEGLTESDRLKQQGVDLGTRAKAGAVAGVVSGGSMLVPMAAPTRLGRFVVGSAVGEGTNIGQQEAEKVILDRANYHQLADQYDPFDPVALAVGLVPGLLGAGLGHAAPARHLSDIVETLESHGQRFDASGRLTQGPVTRTGERAQGEMQVMSGTARDPGFGVAPARDDSPAELARVGRDYIAALQAHYGDDAKALAAYNAGPGTLDAALKAHPDDWLAHLPQETQGYVQHGMALAGADRAAADPDAVAAARVTQTADALDRSRLTPDDDLAGADAHQQAVETAFDQIGRGDEVDVSEHADSLVPREAEMAEGAQPGEEPAQAEPAPAGQTEAESPQARVTSLADAVQQLDAQRQPSEPPIKPNHAAFHEAEPEGASRGTPAPKPGAQPATGEAAAAPDAAHLDAAIEQLGRDFPDLKVQLDGMDEPMHVTDLLQQLREEAQRTGEDAHLVEVAAQCAIRS